MSSSVEAEPTTEQEARSAPPSTPRPDPSLDAERPDDEGRERPRGHWFDTIAAWPHRRLIAAAVVAVVVGGLLGYCGALLWPKQYAARADLLFAITREQPTEFLREDRTLTTQVVLMTSRTVLAPVAARNGLEVDELSDDVTAQVVPGSEVLEVEVRDRSPDRALSLTQQIVASYTAVADVQPANPVRDYLEAELAGVRDRLAVARGASPTSPLASEVPSLAERERGLTTQLDSIAIQQLTTPRPQVVVPPYVQGDAIGPSSSVGAVAGGLVALVGVAALLLITTTRRRARGVDP
ncbi:hypothetical protein [Actinomycetospora straminea]|nr:hypothetical protein [Actinomycetospora straminea]MDD7931045.1 hypothetical protein [Actinomycetospora straminea]